MIKDKKGKILVTCPKGIETYLRDELTGLGYPVISGSTSGVETEGTLDDTMKLNLCIRTGQRVLFFINKFNVLNINEFYRNVKRIRWEDYIYEDGYICVTSFVDSPLIKDSRFANLKCKDAVVDRFREKYGRRPDSGPDRNSAVIFIYWKDYECSIYLDTSGETLSKRNYRKIPLEAPMQEALAASVISATGWAGYGDFINPMCGSGTLAIEAALIALNRPSGLSRKSFGFMHLRGFDRVLWEKIRHESTELSTGTLNSRIIATDKSTGAVVAARENAVYAGVENMIEFKVCDFSDTPVPARKGIVIFNPAYGERMGEVSKLENTYRKIGDFLKQRCGGYRGYIFTGNLDLARKVGLRTKRRIQFFNGKIECRLLEYELYEGSRKT
ncbi:ribosomal RNA large subunit methyltransferase L [bacterium BMS3Abin07]|nr:ribosomal RNA large subunit methyltransferase L [bacterium BMS3Abin07]GBE32909.1 ribosomal RNA large subunit methyltransferase L [bacterium BMS3Bbin05]HDO23191.1 class I SAM-dependent RNA methyltransferase [Nitrospirota bacterium]HDZ88941.1 class I SAM-dependent RNA methyltransferase [Nitrospirota bacterium]